MIIPANDNSNFNQVLADALEREKAASEKTGAIDATAYDVRSHKELIPLVGQYLIDHADELYPVEYSDLTGNDIHIHIRRIGTPYTKEAVTLSVETIDSLRHAAGRAISFLQSMYEILDAELMGSCFEEDADKIFREWRNVGK